MAIAFLEVNKYFFYICCLSSDLWKVPYINEPNTVCGIAAICASRSFWIRHFMPASRYSIFQPARHLPRKMFKDYYIKYFYLNYKLTKYDVKLARCGCNERFERFLLDGVVAKTVTLSGFANSLPHAVHWTAISQTIFLAS